MGNIHTNRKFVKMSEYFKVREFQIVAGARHRFKKRAQPLLQRSLELNQLPPSNGFLDFNVTLRIYV